MLDPTRKEAVARDSREQARAADARWSDRMTSLVLLMTSFVACALFVIEATLGLFWALSGGFREYATLLMH